MHQGVRCRQRSFWVLETGRHPEKVGKDAPAGANGPLDPFQGDIFSGSPVSAMATTPLLLSALYARVPVRR